MSDAVVASQKRPTGHWSSITRATRIISSPWLKMLFSEIIKMALASLGANKLRAALTMIGITIGVFFGDLGDDCYRCAAVLY